MVHPLEEIHQLGRTRISMATMATTATIATMATIATITTTLDPTIGITTIGTTTIVDAAGDSPQKA